MSSILHLINIEDVSNGTYEIQMILRQKFINILIMNALVIHIPPLDKNGKQLIDNHGQKVQKHRSLCNMKCFIIDTVKPKTIPKFFISAIS